MNSNLSNGQQPVQQQQRQQQQRVIRRRHPHTNHTFCSVCGKKAFYQFYGTLACDSCRTFFRRCVLRKLDIPCINMDGCCDINPRTRKDCTSCRFQKCLYVGMRPDLVTNPQSNNQVACSSGLSSISDQHSSLSALSSQLLKSPSNSLYYNYQCSKPNTTINGEVSYPIFRVENPTFYHCSSTSALEKRHRQYPHSHPAMIGTSPVPQVYQHLKLQLLGTSSPRIPRPEVPVIDTHIQGLTLGEKVKLYEMISVIHSTILRPEDLRHFNGDTRSDLNTMTCIFISRVIRSLSKLKAAEYLGNRDREILLKGSVGQIVFLRSIPQFDYESKDWVVYKNPLDRKEEKSRFPMALMSLLNPSITDQFDGLVGEIDPTARGDFIFMVILSAICFYDPSQSGLASPEMVTYEQNVFYSILRKLIVSQSSRCSGPIRGLHKSSEAAAPLSPTSLSSALTVSYKSACACPISPPHDDGEGCSSGTEVPNVVTKVSACCPTSAQANRSLAQELEEKVFRRLKRIQESFEKSILDMDPGEQIRLISCELKLTSAQTIYNLMSHERDRLPKIGNDLNTRI